MCQMLLGFEGFLRWLARNEYIGYRQHSVKCFRVPQSRMYLRYLLLQISLLRREHQRLLNMLRVQPGFSHLFLGYQLAQRQHRC